MGRLCVAPLVVWAAMSGSWCLHLCISCVVSGCLRVASSFECCLVSWAAPAWPVDCTCICSVGFPGLCLGMPLCGPLIEVVVCISVGPPVCGSWAASCGLLFGMFRTAVRSYFTTPVSQLLIVASAPTVVQAAGTWHWNGMVVRLRGGVFTRSAPRPHPLGPRLLPAWAPPVVRVP